MTVQGSIVVLNGPPRSGKSSIAAAIQAADGPWMNLGVDLVRAATPVALQPGIGLRPGGERPELEPFVVASYLALYDSVVAHARRGISVVVDVGHHDEYSRPLHVLETISAVLAEVGALFVGVSCPVEILLRRREETGWGPPNPPFLPGTRIPVAVGRWSSAVHDPGVYDVEVDTSLKTPDEAASEILNRLGEGVPTAFTRIAASRS